MSLSPRKIVRAFYGADLIHNEEIITNYLHPDAVLCWNSRHGYFEKDFDDLVALFKGMQDSFESSRNEITHIITEKNTVTIRHTFYAKPIESQMEHAVSNFICIWELKDDKLHKGFMISQTSERE